MCEFYVCADPILYESRTRTVRIRGVSTSIRMENFAWDVLARMAREEGMTTNALIACFHGEILQSRGDVQNFTSFLRVTCLRYLHRKCEQAAADAKTVSADDAQEEAIPALERALAFLSGAGDEPARH